MKAFINYFFLLAAVLVVAVWFFAPSRGGEGNAPAFGRDHVTLETAEGAQIYLDVETATTSAQRDYGLMFRRSMSRDAGMLFLFNPPEETSFWMKNTFIPLDILFVRPGGQIAKIVADAKPHDLTSILSEEPVAAVIELNAGEAERRGIKIGTKLIHPELGGP
ncbi:MAG: DUF192 domain-containing protein [Alphaproteobacteria bacterium]|nr:DUF192 domain-containing protein [Alphaproteobacteria bacterium]